MEEETVRPFFKDCESFFAEFIEFSGGVVIDKLPENKIDRENADYLFTTPAIISELKILKKDSFSEAEDISRVISELLEKKFITHEQIMGYVFKGEKLPDECLNKMIEKASNTIERAIYKANKQIEVTKKTFSMEAAAGIIFLLNDGNYFFTIEGFLSVISNIIARKFKNSAFDVIVYLTVNQSLCNSQNNLDYGYWVSIYTKVNNNGDTIISEEVFNFVNELGRKFGNDFMEMKTGFRNTNHVEIDNYSDYKIQTSKLSYIPKQVIYKK